MQILLHFLWLVLLVPTQLWGWPSRALVLHWWIQRLLWADLSGGAPSCTFSETRKFHGLELGSSWHFSHCTPPMGLTHVLSWRSAGTSKVNLILFVRTFGYKQTILPCDRARHCNPAERAAWELWAVFLGWAKMVLKGTGKKKLVMRRVCSFPLACYVKVMGRQQPVQRSHA